MHKAELRRRALGRRGALSPETRAAYSRSICRRLQSLPELRRAKTVLSYMAMPSEADLAALHEVLWAAGVRLCFPVTRGQGQMEAVACGRSGPWNKGAFGIREPAGEEVVPPEDIDAVLVPCVAFDELGTRLGHGGGYYDRYLPMCTQARILALAFPEQIEGSLPTDEHDFPIPTVLTNGI